MDDIKTITDRIEHLEFRQRLLFDNTSVDRILFEYDVTQEQYRDIMDLMDLYRKKIDKGEKVYHGSFESKIYEIVQHHAGDYHFVESLVQAFKECGRWDEIFPTLYGDMPKYKYLKNKDQEVADDWR